MITMGKVDIGYVKLASPGFREEEFQVPVSR